MSSPADTASGDQVEAATRHAEDVLRRVTGPLDGELHHNVPPQDWVKLLNDQHELAIHAGRGSACRHFGKPQPYYIASWLPGRVICGPCAANGGLPVADEIINWTCDRCRKYRPGRVALTAIRSGMVTMFVGLCPDCRHLE